MLVCLHILALNFQLYCAVEDVDMNVELMAHGYSNFAVGLFGGMCRFTHLFF